MIIVKSKKKIIGFILTIAMLSSVFANAGIAKAVELDKNKLEDGKYTVNVDLYHSTDNKPSMASGIIEKKAEIVVKDGVAKLYLHFMEMNMMGVKARLVNFKAFKAESFSGEEVTTEIIKTIKYTYTQTGGVETTIDSPTEIAVELPHRNEFVYAEMTNTFMPGTQNARVKIDWNSLEKTETPEPEIPQNILGLEDGEYKLPINMWNATEDKPSMASSAILENAKVIVEGKSAKMIVYTKEMKMGNIVASLQTLKVKGTSGNYIEAQVVAKDDKGNPTAFQFEIPQKSEFLDVLVNPKVEMMGNKDIPARIKADYKMIEKVETGANVNPGYDNNGNHGNNSGNTNDITKPNDRYESPKTGDEMQVAILVVSMMVALIGGVQVYRKK